MITKAVGGDERPDRGAIVERDVGGRKRGPWDAQPGAVPPAEPGPANGDMDKARFGVSCLRRGYLLVRDRPALVSSMESRVSAPEVTPSTRSRRSWRRVPR
jgi:hypothetical protein